MLLLALQYYLHIKLSACFPYFAEIRAVYFVPCKPRSLLFPFQETFESVLLDPPRKHYDNKICNVLTCKGVQVHYF